ncbi:MAG: YCF48-related protein, partial [Flavobacteriales bacterium]|nr:YCF48-related protein [Flavobacteriales bacterium]
MKKILLLAVFLITISASAQWRVTTPLGSTIFDITFTSDSVGYAISQSGFIGGCNQAHSMLKTIDGGVNWVRLRAGITEELNSVHFVDPLTGWIAADGSRLIKTEDGGMTWNLQTSGIGVGINDVFFIDENRGFILGGNGLVRRSLNGGDTWQTISSGNSSTLRRIDFPDSQTGYIVTSDGSVLKTENAGDSWSSVFIDATSLQDVKFITADEGYVIGFSDGNSTVFKTTNGGDSWTQTVLPINGRRISFPDENTGYIQSIDSGIMKTTNGGETWTQIVPNDGNLNLGFSIYFANADYGFVGGGGGRIARTNDGGETWTSSHTAIFGDALTLAQPNKDTTYI